MEWEVERVVGPKGRHDRERTAKRHGHTPGEVTLGGRRVPISRPRVRTADDTEEIGLDSYQEFASRDLLEQVALERMLAGVSTRRSRRVEEPVGEDVRESARSTSKSAVSRSFVARTRTALEELLGRDLSDLELAVMMIDGIDLADVTHVVALGITVDGTKVPLSLREGRPRTRPSRPRCSQTWSTAGCGSQKSSCSCSTARRRSARPCGTSPAPRRWCTAATSTNTEMCAVTCPTGSVHGCARSSARRGPIPTTPGRSRHSRRSPLSSRRCTRTRRLAQGGHGGDAHPDPSRGDRHAAAHAVLDELDREHVRHRPHHPAQRQALARRGHATAVDRRRDGRKRNAASGASRATATYPSSSTRSDANSTHRHRPREPLPSSPPEHHTRTAVEVLQRTGHPHQRLALLFIGYVLGQVQYAPPSAGAIVGLDGRVHKVSLDSRRYAELEAIIDTLRTWIQAPSADAPPVV